MTLRGDLAGSDQPIHLVEGHTRYGALRGLVEAGVVGEDSLHEVWIGEPALSPASDGPWREVLKREHVRFHDWLMDQIGSEGDLGRIADRLITVKHSSSSRRRVRGDDLAAVLAFAEGDAKLAPLQDVIRRVHGDWERFVGLLE